MIRLLGICRATASNRAGSIPSGLLGFRVRAVRVSCLVIRRDAGRLECGHITMVVLRSVTDGITAGRGYVAIAVVIIERWTPSGAVAGALLFSFFDSLGLRSQLTLPAVPNEAFSILPYAMTLLVLVATARSSTSPRTLGAPLPP